MSPIEKWSMYSYVLNWVGDDFRGTLTERVEYTYVVPLCRDIALGVGIHPTRLDSVNWLASVRLG